MKVRLTVSITETDVNAHKTVDLDTVMVRVRDECPPDADIDRVRGTILRVLIQEFDGELLPLFMILLERWETNKQQCESLGRLFSEDQPSAEAVAERMYMEAIHARGRIRLTHLSTRDVGIIRGLVARGVLVSESEGGETWVRSTEVGS